MRVPLQGERISSTARAVLAMNLSLVGTGRGPGVDLVGDHFVVEVKTLGLTRVDDLIGRLATAVLQVQARRMPGKHGMVMIGIDRLGARSLAAV